MRHTKIVATLGPATDAPGVLDELVAAGMDCARLNCSHSDPTELVARAAQVRASAERAKRPISLLLDLQGPKLRLTADTPVSTFKAGDTVTFAADGASANGALRVSYDDFAALCTTHSHIVVGDGTPRFEVRDIDGALVRATCSAAGELGPRKGVNITHAQPRRSALTDKDLADIAVAAQVDADFVALSFVRSGDDVRLLREHLLAAGSHARVIAKVEKVEALENLAGIIAASDGVMVARGDFGVEAGVAHVPAMQKEVIRRATDEGKLVITATQMLESMIASPQPTRAEALDLYNAVIDGTSAMMLSAETSIGQYPAQAVRMMDEVAQLAEASPDIYCARHGAQADGPDAAVMYAAVALGRDSDAAALVVPTSTGGTPRACAKYRPQRPVIALCHEERVARQLALEWGVCPTFMRATDSTDEMLGEAVRAARPFGLRSGDSVVVTSGPTPGHAGATNLIALMRIP